MAELKNAQTMFEPTRQQAEERLLEQLNRVETSSHGYYSVHIHLSQLKHSNRQPHFINIAARAFDTIIDDFDATFYQLSNKDLVLICHEVPVDELDTVIDKVRGLFNEDPLTIVDSEDFEDRLATWHDLSVTEEFASFYSIIAEIAVEAERLREEAKRLQNEQAEKGEPLTPFNLAEISKKLMAVRIGDMMQEQICLLVRTGGGGEIVFREKYFSMNMLRKRIAPDTNLFSSPWLFQFLSESLDKRLLNVFCEQDLEPLVDNISLNLNIATVLSKDFQKFHRHMDGQASKMIIEMQIIDILSDLKSFGYARDLLQERGYRVLVDGLSPVTLRFLMPATLKSDFVKISWVSESEDEEENAKNLAEITETVHQTGREGVILARVDTEKAVKWGLGIGVSRFQGFFIDKLAESMSSKPRKKAAK